MCKLEDAANSQEVKQNRIDARQCEVMARRKITAGLRVSIFIKIKMMNPHFLLHSHTGRVMQIGTFNDLFPEENISYPANLILSSHYCQSFAQLERSPVVLPGRLRKQLHMDVFT